MDVGEEDFDGAAGAEEVCDFDQGDEVRAVGAPGGGGAPVDFEGPLLVQDDFFEDRGFEHFGEVLGDEGEAGLGGEVVGGHCGESWVGWSQAFKQYGCAFYIL